MPAALLEFALVTPNAAPEVHALYQHCPSYFHLIGMEVPTLADVEREVEASQLDPKRSCHLVRSDGQLVAYLDYKLDYPEEWAATISLLLVDERLQGQGIGARVIHHLEHHLHNIHHLFAVVYGNNSAANRFWEKLGFRFYKDGGPSLRWYLKNLGRFA